MAKGSGAREKTNLLKEGHGGGSEETVALRRDAGQQLTQRLRAQTDREQEREKEKRRYREREEL